jgi:hypothetical protein
MSTTATHPQTTATDPKPAETTTVPAMTTTTEAEPKQSQTATDVKLAAEAPQSQANEKSEASEEPQNRLTEKFTEAEWKALKEFRVQYAPSQTPHDLTYFLQQVQLPDIFADAYPKQPKARETPISLWGVTLDPANPQSDARVSVILMKFLRARWGLFFYILSST